MKTDRSICVGGSQATPFCDGLNLENGETNLYTYIGIEVVSPKAAEVVHQQSDNGRDRMGC